MNIEIKKALIGTAALIAIGIGATLPAGAGIVASAPATLDPGQTVSLPDFPAGAVLIAAQTETFTSANGPAGTINEFVVDQTQFSPFGPGDLTFAFSISLTGDTISKVSLPGFAGFSTAVKTCDFPACIEGTGAVPDQASRSADGDVVSFLWSVPMVRGTSSGFSIYTNATTYTDPPMIQLIDIAGNISVAPTFVPAVPLPGTLFLFGGGLMGLLGFARRTAQRP